MKCRISEKSCEPAARTKVHNLSHLQGKQHWCQKCGINFEPCANSACNPDFAVKAAKVHQALRKTYPCTMCGLTFKKKEALVKHHHRHNGTSQYTCQYCSKGFMDKDCFQSHVKQHQGIKLSVCNICGIEVTTAKGLKKHKDTMHERKEKYKCDTCGLTYRHRSSFVAHCLMHEGKKPHVCQYCHKGFRVGSHLRSHLRTHTGEKPYECDYCGKKFAHNNSCKGHQAICQGQTQSQSLGSDAEKTAPSTGSREQLVQAEKNFGTILLKGTRSHVCQYCNKGFKMVSHLRSHLRMHTGEKPYECDFCGKKFAHNNRRRGHQAICQGNQEQLVQAEKNFVTILPKGASIASETENLENQPVNLVYLVNDITSDSEGGVQSSEVRNVLEKVHTVEVEQTESVDASQATATVEAVEQCVDESGYTYIKLSDGNKLYVSVSQDSDLLRDNKQKGSG